MFDDRGNGRGQPECIDAAATCIGIVQHSRLAAPPIGGSWCIPSISDDVPSMLQRAGSKSAAHIAALALKGHADGVPLSDARFTTAKAALEDQWRAFVKLQCTAGLALGLDIQFRVDEHEVQAVVSANSDIPTFRLKPVIERLNAALPGLGWFVFEAVMRISAHGFPVYDMATMSHVADMIWHHGSLTDEEMARHIADMDGGKRESVAKMRKRHKFPWPSALDAAVDHHAWMLRRRRYDEKGNDLGLVQQPPKTVSEAQARAFLRKKSVPPDLANVVRAALAMFGGEKQSSALGYWDPPVHGDESWTDDGDFDADEPLRVFGATCWIVWDDPQILYDGVSHFERYLMEGGDSTTIHFTLTVDPTDSRQLEGLVSQLKKLIGHYALASDLLHQFPKG